MLAFPENEKGQPRCFRLRLMRGEGIKRTRVDRGIGKITDGSSLDHVADSEAANSLVLFHAHTGSVSHEQQKRIERGTVFDSPWGTCESSWSIGWRRRGHGRSCCDRRIFSSSSLQGHSRGGVNVTAPFRMRNISLFFPLATTPPLCEGAS